MNYIVFDLEFNQPFNFKSGKKDTVEPRMPFEIIQIGAVKVDEKFNIIDTFDYFIKPQVYKKIHPIVERITGITNEKLENANDFIQAYASFCEFVGTEEHYLCTWGLDDIKSLFKNVLFHSCDENLLSKSCINIQFYATKHLCFETGNAIGLKNAIELLEMEEERPYHDALNDAYYTAKVFQAIPKEDVKIIEFDTSTMFKDIPVVTKTNTKKLLNYFETSLDRPLTAEEKAIIRTAYKFGKKKTYEAKVKK